MSKYNDILEKVNNSNDSYEYEDLAARSKTESVWDTHRKNSTLVADLYNNSEFDNYHRRMEDCASRLDFKQVADPETGEVNIKLKKTFFCRVRHCPVCQWRKSLFWKARFYKALPEITANNKTARWVFLTLTVKNCDVRELNKTIALMNKAFFKMIRRKCFLKYNLGFVKTIEITRNKKTNEAHPHFHILLLQRRRYFDKCNYMETEDWAELWRDCLNVSYIPQVNVQAVKLRGKSKDDKDKELVDAVKETLKYAVKPADMVQDRGWFLEMTNQLFKSRLLSTGGVLKNSFKEDVSEEEMLLQEDEDQDQDVGLITFNWYKSLFKYRRKLNDDVVQADDSKAYLKHKQATINAIKSRIEKSQDEREERERVIKHIAEIEALVKARNKEEIDKIDVPTVTI